MPVEPPKEKNKDMKKKPLSKKADEALQLAGEAREGEDLGAIKDIVHLIRGRQSIIFVESTEEHRLINAFVGIAQRRKGTLIVWDTIRGARWFVDAGVKHKDPEFKEIKDDDGNVLQLGTPD